MRDGGEYYNNIGTKFSKGTKLISLSGKINESGVYEIEFGKKNFYELINEFGNGIKDNKKVKFVIPGGISTELLSEKELNTKIDYESLRDIKSSLGSGAVIVGDEDSLIIDVCCNVADFFYERNLWDMFSL